jgi:hypothetical protein
MATEDIYHLDPITSTMVFVAFTLALSICVQISMYPDKLDDFQNLYVMHGSYLAQKHMFWASITLLLFALPRTILMAPQATILGNASVL